MSAFLLALTIATINFITVATAAEWRPQFLSACRNGCGQQGGFSTDACLQICICMLEQQWLDPKRPRILQVSNGFSYTWDASRPFGERVSLETMTLNGRPIEAGSGYRVTLNDYLAVGGDGFTVAKQGTSPQYGGYDADALFAFFRAHGPIGPLPPTRILRVN